MRNINNKIQNVQPIIMPMPPASRFVLLIIIPRNMVIANLFIPNCNHFIKF